MVQDNIFRINLLDNEVLTLVDLMATLNDIPGRWGG